VRDREAL